MTAPRKVKVVQSCLILYDHMDYSLPGSSGHEILQARILEWVAISFSSNSSEALSKDQGIRSGPIPGNLHPFPKMGFPGGSDNKESTCNVGDLGSIPVCGRSLGGGNGNPFQDSCLENSMDRGAWRAIVHGVTESDTTE